MSTMYLESDSVCLEICYDLSPRLEKNFSNIAHFLHDGIFHIFRQDENYKCWQPGKEGLKCHNQWNSLK